MVNKSNKKLINIENSDIGILQFCLKTLYEHESDELAWRLVERFGSVSEIFSASHEELMQIDGMTDRVATFFTVMRPLQRQAQLRAVKGLALATEREIAEYAAVYFMNEYNPTDVCVCLDKKYRVYHAERLGKDELVREIAAVACRRNAQKIALIRLEPRLIRKPILPSPERLKLLIKITKLLSTLGIEFVDYVEYNQNRFFSLRRAVGGDIGVYHVFDAKEDSVTPWKTVTNDISEYYTTCVAHAIEKNLK
ncbi:MAG: hypothetical protein K2M47_01670 [Clostridiales bacterium]|nr:hypothetical protein [Clostridiales bacterium]